MLPTRQTSLISTWRVGVLDDEKQLRDDTHYLRFFAYLRVILELPKKDSNLH